MQCSVQVMCHSRAHVCAVIRSVVYPCSLNLERFALVSIETPQPVHKNVQRYIISVLNYVQCEIFGERTAERRVAVRCRKAECQRQMGSRLQTPAGTKELHILLAKAQYMHGLPDDMLCFVRKQ